MIIPILIIAVIILLTIGVSLILKGMWGAPDSDKVVSLTDFYKIKTELKDVQGKEGELKQRLDVLSIELEQARGQLEKGKSSEEKIQKLRFKESECQTQIRNLERDLRFLAQKADEQAKRSLGMIRALGAENETLKQKQSQPQPSIQWQQDFEALKTKAEVQARESQATISALRIENVELKKEQGFREKLAALEAVMAGLQRKANEQAQEAMTVIQTLAQENGQLKGQLISQAQSSCDSKRLEMENQQLKDGLGQITQKLTAFDGAMTTMMVQHDQELRSAQETLNTLRQDNDRLQRQLAEVPTQEALQVEMRRIKTEGTVRLQEANAVIQQLRNDIEAFSQQLQENDDLVRRLETDLARSRQEARQARNAVEESRGQGAVGVLSPGDSARPSADDGQQQNQHDFWLQERTHLREEINRLQEANVFLKEKEQALHVKLTQSRAQAMGLEKLLRDFLPAENSFPQT
jgi:chromosome segregation ATPase